MADLNDLRIDLPKPKPGKGRGMSWGPPIFAVLSVAVLVLLFGNPFKGNTSNSSATAKEDRSVEIPASRVTDPESATSSRISGSFTAGGYLEVIPPGPLVVSALIGGRVASIDVIPGMAIVKGDRIATLDETRLKQRFQLQESQVDIGRRKLALIRAGYRTEEIDEAEADKASHQAQLAQMAAEFERTEALFKAGVISAQELEEVRSRYEQAVASLAAAEARLSLYKSGSRIEEIALAEAELAAAEAELSYIEWELAQCVILAPVSGVVTEQFTQPGAWVEPGTDDRHSSALVSILDPKQIQAWVDVNQRDSANLFVGQRAWLTTDAYPGRQIAGEVIQIMPVANLQKNTVQAKLAIKSPPADFRPDLSVKIEFLTEQEQSQ
jgi:multidrug resistance efflux pump